MTGICPPPRGRFAVVGSGTGTTASRLLDAVDDGTIPADVAVVVGNNSRSGILTRARDRGVRTFHLSGKTHPEPDMLDAAMLDALDAAGTDLVVLAGYMKLLGPRVLERFKGAVLNTHPALLPAYGGVGMYGDRVHAAVLADGATRTGATVHQVTAVYDEGPIVAQREVEIRPDDDVEQLRARVQAAEKSLLVDVVAAWFTDAAPPASGVAGDQASGLMRESLRRDRTASPPSARA
ncbi:formyltetrahydrofolate-dependent phosphoribosylglycinamide formyltransferase [Isoptericola sp. CG 20/1183]|uniref:Phosphoribosylglycinamide formyltransferase n=1 Tax=Isoptericola halotolerans TaxID=300560 RepID=A0ABX5EHM4_9MICO|nr:MULTISPECIES: phosphoribosylglycinamide formyltransferase [Isoptericola]PRZ07704.1 formyltetrahydrofolate-dependent phosphoribosylglycinamide formyltransferase [Isoptericola halotolerans]PRZ07937.1 formyltetrahydrofolate-dependent phosphoribosylglycinamide formyltransferase [Isoptericola sp. CG 20/1183]